MNETQSKPVEFFCHAPEAKAIFVAGAFNDWQPDAAPLRPKQPNGNWSTTLPLPLGHYEYKFVVDGQWRCEPGCEHEDRDSPNSVANEFGTMNCVLDVS